MKLKSILFICTFLLIISVAAVSASDFNETSTDASSNIDNALPIDNYESTEPGTFSELQESIDNALTGSVLDLTKDYNGETGSRIEINKDLTIDGHNHTINCLNKENCLGFYSNSGEITIKNLKIINANNNKDGQGGAIYSAGTSKYTIDNCTFENNVASAKGGAIWSKNILIIKNSEFNSNSAAEGGAISCNNLVCIIDSKFNKNTATEHDGGAMQIEKVNLDNCVFTNNYAKEYGGAISCKSFAIANKCQFINNNADFRFTSITTIIPSRGGGICAENAIVTNCLFKNNKAKHYGGGLYCTDGAHIHYCEFRDNSATFGGAIFANTINVNPNQNTQGYTSKFINNHATEKGGAMFANSDVNIAHCILESNGANRGGAIYTYQNTVLNDCKINSNSAEFGGGIHSRNAYLTNCEVSNNRATQMGAGIYTDQTTDLTSCVVNNNIARYNGGGIKCTDAIVKKCRFEENEAQLSSGGAISADNNVKVDNCNFDRNKAMYYGGAIRSGSITFTDEPSIFSGNKASYGMGGAISVNTITNDVVKHIVFRGNVLRADGEWEACDDGYNGGAIAIHSKTTVTFQNCVFKDNYAYNKGGAIYLDKMGSKVSLINNYIAGNFASDYEGHAVYNCGSYGDIKGNYWGTEQENDYLYSDQQLTEWNPIIPNSNHEDSNPSNTIPWNI